MERYFFSTEKMTVGYDGIPLIKNVTVELKKGEILTLIGPNGAGKSTILKSIIGQLSLIGGTVWMEELRLNELSDKERAKTLSAVLTDRIRPELMTCREVVEMGRYPYTGRLGILSDRDREVVEEIMETVRITELADREFVTLSDGQRQRVMFAKAMAQEPEILVLDEPTSFLDIRYKLEFLALLQEMTRRKRLTVIMSLHELDLAERISDQILCVKGEYTERFGPPDQIFVPGYMRELYGISTGTFEEYSGSPELPKPDGKPQVFVIGGNGSAAPLFRKLQRQGIPFSAGILWENDKDMAPARALAARVIAEKAFCSVSQETMEAAKAEIDVCQTVICTMSEFGEWNQENRKLRDYAEEKGKLHRDF